jgi:hypothetical protein
MHTHMIDIQWEQWPPSVPRPTAEEYDAAGKRFREENDHFREQARVEGRRAYGGDTGISLGFDMATCSVGTWWHYFFPVGRRT